ncbi:MAG: hypothetical protein WC050_01430 [Candidatus Paceibacterota bacterium]
MRAIAHVGGLLLAALSYCVPAFAADVANKAPSATKSPAALECFGIFRGSSKSLMDSTGTPVTNGASTQGILDCGPEQGFHVEIFGSVSKKDRVGDEFDLRFGPRGSIGWLNYDATVAGYHFIIGDGSHWNVYNARLDLSTAAFDLGHGVTVTPKLRIDEQHFVNLDMEEMLGIRPSVELGWRIIDSGWKPTIGFEIGAWGYLSTPFPNKGPIVYMVPSFSVTVPATTATLFVEAVITDGRADEVNSLGKWDSAIRVGVKGPFRF